MQHTPFSSAIWIAPSRPCAAPITVRRFSVVQVRHASLSVTGLGYYRVWLNGIALGADDWFQPPQSDYFRRDLTRATYSCHDRFTHRVYYRTYDITALLKNGENVLEIQCGGGFFVQTERTAEGDMTYSDRTQCIYDLAVDGAHILSDGSETWRESNIRASQLFLGETIDARFADDTEYPVIPAALTDTLFTPEDGVPDRIIRTITPEKIGAADGRTIYDAGENISGLVRIRTNAPSGSTIHVRFAEELSASGELDFTSTGSGYICKSGVPQIMADTFVSSGSGDTFLPSFVWHAFRYFDVCGEIEDAEVCVIHADLPVTAAFDSDCEGMNFYFDAYLRTQTSAVHGSVPMDCPHRERLGYTGDGQVTAETAMLILDAQPFYRKWIRDILDCQDPDTGHVQHTAPFQGGGGGPGGWGVAIVTVPWAYYRQYGEVKMLREAYPAMQKWFSYMESRVENGRIVREEEGGWCLGDWCCLATGELPESYVNTALYVRALHMLAEIARIVGDSCADAAYQAAIGRSMAAVRADYAGLSDIGAAMVYAVALGLEDPARMNEYYSALGHFDTGFLTTDLLLELLWTHGCADTAYRLLSATDVGSFLYMRDHGATTIWESWTGGSHCHPMFGAGVRTVLTGLCGIRQTQGGAGWREIIIAPQLPTEMRHAAGRIHTPQGEIAVTLDRMTDGVHATVRIPEGVRAYRAGDGPLSAGVHTFLLSSD